MTGHAPETERLHSSSAVSVLTRRHMFASGTINTPHVRCAVLPPSSIGRQAGLMFCRNAVADSCSSVLIPSMP